MYALACYSEKQLLTFTLSKRNETNKYHYYPDSP